jgi:hypothetical protein
MHDAERMRLGEGLGGLEHVFDGLVDRQLPASLDHLAQVGASEVLHDDERQPFDGRSDVQHTTDVLAPDLHRRARFAREPRDALGVLGAMERLDGGEHDAHAAFSEHVLDGVFPVDDVPRLPHHDPPR